MPKLDHDQLRKLGRGLLPNSDGYMSLCYGWNKDAGHVPEVCLDGYYSIEDLKTVIAAMEKM